MGVAIGSSIQIALLVTPFMVMVGWAIGEPMSLHFETCKSNLLLCSSVHRANLFQVSTVAFAFSVMVVTYTVQDGRSNYLEGAMVSPALSLLLRRPGYLTGYSFWGSTASLRWPSTSAPRSRIPAFNFRHGTFRALVSDIGA